MGAGIIELGAEDIFGVGRPIGEILKDFRLTRKIGKGGMGVVYKAHQISLDQDVALKFLLPRLAENSDFVQRFYREARMSAKLQHAENIVHAVAVGFVCATCGYNGPPEDHPQHPAEGNQPRGLHYFAMEFVDGENLEQWLKRLGRIPVADTVKVGIDVAHALAYAHSLRPPIFHRDVKPANIMITPAGEVKLADLGLAKAAGDDTGLTQIGEMAGTVAYMPPEQARNAAMVDGRSDIYALGTTLYVLLTGKKPFSGDTDLKLVEAKERGTFEPAHTLNPEVPEVLDVIIAKMLAVKASKRYETAREVAGALLATGLASETLGFLETTVPPITVTRPGLPLKRRWRLLAPACVLTALVLAGLYEAARGRQSDLYRWCQSHQYRWCQSPTGPTASEAEPVDVILRRALDQLAVAQVSEARDTLAQGLAAHPRDQQIERPLLELNGGTLVLFQHQTQDETSPLKPLWDADGLTLTQRDNYRFGIVTGRACYVYSYQRDTRPSVTRLFPNSNYSQLTNPIPAGTLTWLPEEATLGKRSWLHLDSAIGEEGVYFVAVTAPLRDPDGFGSQLVTKADILSRTLNQNLGSFLQDMDTPPQSCFTTGGIAMQVFRFKHLQD